MACNGQQHTVTTSLALGGKQRGEERGELLQPLCCPLGLRGRVRAVGASRACAPAQEPRAGQSPGAARGLAPDCSIPALLQQQGGMQSSPWPHCPSFLWCCSCRTKER